MKKRHLIFMFLVLLCRPPAYAGDIDWAALNPELADSTYVRDNNKCLECHEEFMKDYNRTAHSRAAHTMKENDCESCHGPLSKHLTAPRRRPSIAVSFKKERGLTAAQKNSVCLQCHEKGKTALWSASPHDRADIACSDCHNIQKGMLSTLAKQNKFDLCVKCHVEYRAKAQKSSHMPMREGKVLCTDCHNPHGSFTPKLITANSVNEKCYECHTEKRGPFLWEHPPVAENCLNCHDPHGSNLAFLLNRKPPQLCQQCHDTPGHRSFLLSGKALPGGGDFAANGRYLVQKGCTNCHSQIHGSNHPSGARFHR